MERKKKEKEKKKQNKIFLSVFGSREKKKSLFSPFLFTFGEEKIDFLFVKITSSFLFIENIWHRNKFAREKRSLRDHKTLD